MGAYQAKWIFREEIRVTHGVASGLRDRRLRMNCNM